MKSKPCRLGVFFLVSLIVLALLVSCAPPSKEVPSYLIEVTDQLGRVVKLEGIPQRIVSLAPSNTEILFALGLADKIVAVTEYCNYPEAAKDKPKVGGFSTVDIERVVEIQPDLILATGYHKAEVIPGLEKLGLTVLALDPRSLDEALEAITLAGKCTGKEDEAPQLVIEMENRVNAITEKTAGLTEAEKPRVFYIVCHDPLMTVGSDTLIHELIIKAGGINIAQDLTGDYPTIGLETIIAANPQVIIAGTGHGSNADAPLQFAQNEPRLADVDARVNNQVYGIDADLISRPGPRIADGLELLAKMIHPEIFEGMIPSPMEVIDQAGRVVRIERMPEKIISLAPSNTEILFALGLEDKLVGVTKYCDYPEAAKDKPKVGGFSTVDIERVVEIQPDLILAVNIHKKEVIPSLERLGLTVVCLDPKTLEEVLEAITLVGQCTGEEDGASRLVAKMRRRIEAVTSKTTNLTEAQKPRVFVIMWHDPLNSTLLGLRHDIIVKAGGINIAEELGGASPTVTLEWVIDTNPEVIIASVGMGTGEDLTFQFALNEKRLAGVDARVNNRVYQIDMDLFGRPGPRIADGLELLAKMIHPEIFGEVE